MKTIPVKTHRRNEFIDITHEVQSIVGESTIQSGICIIYCPHTTAGLTINENADPDVTKDMLKHLALMVPENSGFAHSEGNSDSHIKASLMGNSVQVIIEQGQLVLGTWQGIYFCEFDGPRQRNVLVKNIAE